MSRPPRSRRPRASAETKEAGRLAVEAVRRLRLWRNQMEGWLGFLEELTAVSKGDLTDWRIKMRRHYSRLIARNLENVPQGGERSALDYRARLNTLLRDA